MTDIDKLVRQLWTALKEQVKDECVSGVDYRCTATLTEVDDNLRLAVTWTPIDSTVGRIEREVDNDAQ